MQLAQKSVNSPYLMLTVLMIGAFSGLFGETALNMALTTLMDEFSITSGIAQWLVTGYLLTLAVFMPISAFLMRCFNTKSLVVSAIFISFAGCMIAVASTELPTLMLGRVVQAVGTAIILPILISCALLIFPMQKRAAVMGIVGIAITLAPALGPTLSGFIITFINWRAIFMISALIYFIIFILAIRVVENIGDITRPKIDIISIVLSTIGFSGIIYSFATLAENSFSSVTVWAPLAIGIISLGVFVWRQSNITEPMINLQVFNNQTFIVGLLLMMICMMSILATAIILPLYLIEVLLLQAALAGMFLLPGNLLNVLFSPLIGILYNRYDSKLLAGLGAVFILISASAFLLLMNQAALPWQVTIAFMCLCIGVTCIIMPAQTAALSALPKELYSDGSSVWNTFYQVSGAAGSSIAITIMTNTHDNVLKNGRVKEEITALALGAHSVFYLLLFFGFIALILAFKLNKPHTVLKS
ncbi:DHA2 family efflux MFS transporter permease subunit [Vibrio aphrogenes]|uniref:DHA2 family efflux MFS transporter permease subunit n=1 Tax=Vibrio aphrogenes TaxID=1891186 RepID=UPI0018D4DE45|nr:DHA2 family efflux MFS transporter permease subunit [Vibrio aphrogenes]